MRAARQKCKLGDLTLDHLEVTTQQAIALMESLTLSHGLQMGDALIAATALEHRLTLVTGNVKHFRAVSSLQLEAFVP